MRTIMIFALLALLTLQCSDAGKPTTPVNPNPPDNRTVKQLTQDEKGLVQSVNTFSFKLLQRVDQSTPKGENIFISPLSVSYALGMTYNGADGQTRSEMASTLEISGFSVDQANQAYHGLTSILTKADPEVTFAIANSFWSRQGKEIQPKFITACQDYFNARVESIDFQAPDAADRINGWVSDNTNGKITNIINPPIDPTVAAILMNALYLKANWTYPFDTEYTHSSMFYLADGTEKPCMMMTKMAESDRQNYDNYVNRPLTAFGTDVCLGISIPYGREGFYMTLLLPNESLTADSLISLLTPETWQAWRQGQSAGDFSLCVPKFKLEYEVGLKNILTALGMPTAFSSSADFGNMFVEGSACISDVRHKTYVQVDEKGTEAAAVTVVVIGDNSDGPIIFSRPFVFIIHEIESGAILFMGKIEDPKWE